MGNYPRMLGGNLRGYYESRDCAPDVVGVDPHKENAHQAEDDIHAQNDMSWLVCEDDEKRREAVRNILELCGLDMKKGE